MNLLRKVCCIAAVIALSGPVSHAADPPGGDSNLVSITTKKEGDHVRIIARTLQLADVTVTIEADLVNMRCHVPLPHTVVCPGLKDTEILSIWRGESGQTWHYSYKDHYFAGDPRVRHDASQVYALPYASGKHYVVIQGFNGKFSHFGDSQYSIDWGMPVGSEVRACRAGVVVATKDDSDVGGPDREFMRWANYVMIKHQDGTYGVYMHLMKDGVHVKGGQRVEAGTVLGYSGNTGFSSKPHLHFCVCRPVDGTHRETFPICFKTSNEVRATLAQGKTYTAP